MTEVLACAAALACSPNDAAKLIGVSRQTIYNMMADGRLTKIKLGRATRIRVSEIEAMLEQGVADAA